MKQIMKITLSALLLGFIVMAGCDKNKPYKILEADSQVHFTGAAVQSYAVRSAGVGVYNLEIGTTDIADVDRTVSFTVTSNTGAVKGTQYNIGLPTNTVTIPANKSLATIPIQGIFAGYPIGRIDTLIITLTEPSIKAANFSNTVKLALGDICTEGVGFTASSFVGTYAHTNEDFGGAYGPYTTTIASVTPINSTSATIVVTNLFDAGWNPISFTLDWSNPNNRTATVVSASSGIGDAGTINPTYTGYQVAVRPYSGQTGTFSSCYQTFTLKMQLGVAGLGWFTPVYTVNMAH